MEEYLRGRRQAATPTRRLQRLRDRVIALGTAAPDRKGFIAPSAARSEAVNVSRRRYDAAFNRAAPLPLRASHRYVHDDFRRLDLGKDQEGNPLGNPFFRDARNPGSPLQHGTARDHAKFEMAPGRVYQVERSPGLHGRYHFGGFDRWADGHMGSSLDHGFGPPVIGRDDPYGGRVHPISAAGALPLAGAAAMRYVAAGGGVRVAGLAATLASGAVRGIPANVNIAIAAAMRTAAAPKLLALAARLVPVVGLALALLWIWQNWDKLQEWIFGEPVPGSIVLHPDLTWDPCSAVSAWSTFQNPTLVAECGLRYGSQWLSQEASISCGQRRDSTATGSCAHSFAAHPFTEVPSPFPVARSILVAEQTVWTTGHRNQARVIAHIRNRSGAQVDPATIEEPAKPGVAQPLPQAIPDERIPYLPGFLIPPGRFAPPAPRIRGWQIRANRALQRLRHPEERTQQGHGYRPGRIELPGVAPDAWTVVIPSRTRQPGRLPYRTLQVAQTLVGNRVETRLARGDQPRRPPPGTREEKLRLVKNRALALLWRSFGPITETLDFVQALYYALPQDLQTARSMRQRFEAVLSHHREINFSVAVRNLLINEAGDRFVASGSRTYRRSHNQRRGAYASPMPTAGFSRLGPTW